MQISAATIARRHVTVSSRTLQYYFATNHQWKDFQAKQSPKNGISYYLTFIVPNYNSVTGELANHSLPTVAALCEQADEQMFHSIKYKPTHPLRPLLPPECSTPYCTRPRLHYYELPSKINNTDECNFIYRVLYKDCF